MTQRKPQISVRAPLSNQITFPIAHCTAIGICISDQRPPRTFLETLTGQKLPNAIKSPSRQQLYKTNKEMFLRNGDKCALDQHVIAQNPSSPVETFVAQVKEIIQVQGSLADLSRKPEAILLQIASTTAPPSDIYRMPSIRSSDLWCLVPIEVSSFYCCLRRCISS